MWMKILAKNGLNINKSKAIEKNSADLVFFYSRTMLLLLLNSYPLTKELEFCTSTIDNRWVWMDIFEMISHLFNHKFNSRFFMAQNI